MLHVAGPLAVLLVLNRLGITPCPFAVATGHPCPGCGLTRATLFLLHGDLGSALRMHPLAPIVAPLLGGFLAYAVVDYVWTGRWPATEDPAAGRLVIAGLLLWTALLAVWLARFEGAFGGPVPV